MTQQSLIKDVKFERYGDDHDCICVKLNEKRVGDIIKDHDGKWNVGYDLAKSISEHLGAVKVDSHHGFILASHKESNVINLVEKLLS